MSQTSTSQAETPNGGQGGQAPGQGAPAGNGNGRSPKGPRKKTRLTALVVLLAVILLAGGGYWWLTRGRVSTDDAFVDGHIYTITPRVDGYVIEVPVDNNQEVQKDQVLMVLDPTDYEVAVAQARASLAEAEAVLTSLELGVPLELSQTDQRVKGAQAELAILEKKLAAAEHQVWAAEQDLKSAQAQLKLSSLDLERIQALRQKNAVAQASLDQARATHDSAQARERAAKDQRDAAIKSREALRAELGKSNADIELAATGKDTATIKAREVEAQRARVKLAQAKLHQAELNLSYTQIKAPVHGLITKKKLEPGQMVSQGQSLLAVVPLDRDNLWITANYKETELTHVHPDQPVSIEVDTFPGRELKGKVDSIMAGTGAAFSLFPPENATGNYVKVVQRIPVKIVLDDQQDGDLPPLRIGMSVVPTIFTDR